MFIKTLSYYLSQINKNLCHRFMAEGKGEYGINKNRIIKNIIIGIPLRNHIIIGGNNNSYYSFFKNDKLDYEFEHFESNINYIDFEKGIVKDLNEKGYINYT